MYHNMFFDGMWFSWIFWIVIVVIISWLIFSVSNRSKGTAGESQPKDTPLDILKKRYAKGEIDKNEFEEKKRDLTN